MDAAPPIHRSQRTKSLLPALATLVIVFAGIGYLFYSSSGEAFEYYKHVDELTQNPGQWSGKHLQMHGFVVPGSIAKRMDQGRQQIEYKFQAVNCEKTVEVRYSGTVPDTFKDRAEVVVKGTLDGNQFHASEISAKCPSKYSTRPDGPAATMCTRGDKSL
ncbi:MAG: cytochrome c maturation protein CcmE [Polyangia bacterium]